MPEDSQADTELTENRPFGHREPPTRRSTGRPAVVAPALSYTLVASSLGVLLIAIGYAMGRSHQQGAAGLYWTGEVVMFGAFALYILANRAITTRAAAAVTIFLALETYLAKWLYSPLRLSFSDELQHWRGATNALSSGGLNLKNTALPIASDFPGLAALGSSFSAVTGLSVNTSGLIIAAVIRVAFLLLILAIFTKITNNARIAILGILAYAANDGFLFFSSFYIYQNLAIVFMFAAIYALVSISVSRRAEPTVWLCAYVSATLAIISHHVTGIFMVGVIVLFVVFDLFFHRKKFSLPILIFAAYSALFSLYWLFVRASNFGHYIAPYTTSINNQSVQTDVPAPTVYVVPPNGPILESSLSRIGIAITILLILVGLVRGTKQYDRRWRWTFYTVAAALVVANILRFVVATGSQIADRGAPFSYLGVGFVAATALYLLESATTRRTLWRWLVVPALLLPYLGGVTSGWPPWWEKTPGGFYERGYESGFDPLIRQAADWTATNIPVGSRFAADANGGVAVSTVGLQQVVTQAAPIFYEDSVNTQAIGLINEYRVKYIWVDSRLATAASPSARYFSGGIGSLYTFPPTTAQLSKFDEAPGLDLIYSNGPIRIYEVGG